jgi:hypothetical protein
MLFTGLFRGGLALGVATLGTLFLTLAPHSYPHAFAGTAAPALGPLLALLEARALRHREARVAGKGGVPFGARTAKVDGASSGLVQLRVPAGSAEPGIGTQLEPRNSRRLVGHETQDMPLSRPALGVLTEDRQRERPFGQDGVVKLARVPAAA